MPASFRGGRRGFNSFNRGQQSYGSGYRGSYGSYGGSYGRGQQQQSTSGRGYTRASRPINPSGPDGQPLTCRSCGSYRHLLRECPDSWENRESKVNVTQDSNITQDDDTTEEHVVLFTGFNKVAIDQLGIEARQCAVLDSACSSTVCGKMWLDNYLDCLDSGDRAKVERKEGHRLFRFGGGTVLKSLAEYRLPAVLAGKNITLITDVVDSNIPLLLSRSAMKNARIKLDLVNDTAEVFGKEIVLNMTTSGHYCLPIDKLDRLPFDNVCVVDLKHISNSDREKVLLKLHRQFAHPSEKRLIALLEDANIWDENYRGVIDKIQQNCEICKVYARTPSRPVVALPMAKAFNDIVAMDLKKWGERWILHMVDMWSRYTVSCFIDRKNPKCVIDKIMGNWIAIFGVMRGIMTDNGGEFSSEETREVASILNLRINTSAAESPFQNGLCERIHSITDMMLLKLKADNPQTSLETLLKWANMARNSLQMYHGYSSHQLVFGISPNLPNILCDQPPALEGSTSSEVMARHLNALHAARESFIQSEASERIRRALRYKIRASEQIFYPGDNVFYKREGKERWLGPGKVIFQDGKVIFIRHGGIFVRVSPNRLIKAGGYTLDDDVRQDGDKKVSKVFEEECESDENDFGEMIPRCPNNENNSIETISRNQGGAVEKTVTVTVPKVGDSVKYFLPDLNDWIHATVLSKAGKASGRYKHWFNIRDSDGTEKSLDFGQCLWENVHTEESVNLVLIPKSEQNSPECLQAKEIELEKLRNFETYTEVEDIGQSRISSTWVLWQKGDGIRARLVARGFEEEQDLRSDSPTIGKSAIRILITIATSSEWKIKTTDIKSAFLQSKPIEREVFLQPPEEADVQSGFIWKLERCLYGLNDAARQFYSSVTETLILLGCSQSKLDPSLFYSKNPEGELQGILVSHIDDFLHSGDGKFETDIMAKLKERFLAGKVAEDSFSYVGFQIHQEPNSVTIDQNNYVKNIEINDVTPARASQKQSELNSQEHTQLRSLAGKLNWIVQGTRPDMVFDLVNMSIKFKSGKVVDLLQAIKAIKYVKGGECKILYPNIGPIENGWKLILFSDASHANLDDGVSSMRAYVIFLVGIDKLCCPISWSGNKIKRVVRSTIAAEALSLLEGLEDAIYLRDMIKELVSVPDLPISAFVDNKSVVESVHSTKMVEDKRLRIDISAIKQLLDNGDVKTIRWCPGASQLADCMTKKGSSGFQLLQIFQTGILSEEYDI
jgi:transposase InsO family protein